MDLTEHQVEHVALLGQQLGGEFLVQPGVLQVFQNLKENFGWTKEKLINLILNENGLFFYLECLRSFLNIPDFFLDRLPWKNRSVKKFAHLLCCDRFAFIVAQEFVAFVQIFCHFSLLNWLIANRLNLSLSSKIVCRRDLARKSSNSPFNTVPFCFLQPFLRMDFSFGALSCKCSNTIEPNVTFSYSACSVVYFCMWVWSRNLVNNSFKYVKAEWYLSVLF